MTKLETRLSKEWINHLWDGLSARKDRILLTKIHGHAEQERMVDYVGCYRGRHIALEFKTGDGELEDHQYDYLLRTSINQGLGIVIRFVGRKQYITYYTHTMELSKEYDAMHSPLAILTEGLKALGVQVEEKIA